MKKYLLSFWALLLLTSCSSSKIEEVVQAPLKKSIKRIYLVEDGSTGARPDWIDYPTKVKGSETDKFTYFSFESETKVTKRIACNILKANVKENIGSEIAVFIDIQLEALSESDDDSNIELGALRQYVENSLAQKIEEKIDRLSIIKTYWEKRQYKTELGSKQEFSAYTCAVLVRMNTSELVSAVNEAVALVLEQTDDEGTKEILAKVLDSAADRFIRSRIESKSK